MLAIRTSLKFLQLCIVYKTSGEKKIGSRILSSLARKKCFNSKDCAHCPCFSSKRQLSQILKFLIQLTGEIYQPPPTIGWADDRTKGSGHVSRGGHVSCPGKQGGLQERGKERKENGDRSFFFFNAKNLSVPLLYNTGVDFLFHNL